jgi:3-hydroxybutyrate dehydrogenase
MTVGHIPAVGSAGQFDGQVAVITGAASGIGAAIATRLADDGAHVVCVDLQPSSPPNDQGISISADLTTREGNKAAIDAALDTYGRLDMIIPNAGFQHVAPIAEFDPDRWDALLKILLTSPFLLAHYGWNALVDSPAGGRIVVVASAHALTASPYKAGYVSAKHGVLGLVKTLAIEGGDVGITACALCPAYVRTPLVEKQIADQAKAHGISEDRVLSEVLLERQVVKALIEPEDVAAAAAFLLSKPGRSFTGVAVPMDQGWTAR